MSPFITAFLPPHPFTLSAPYSRLLHRPFQSHSITPTALTSPPLNTSTPRGPKPLAYSRLLSQCADALLASSTPSKLTIDFPPEYSETRAGTLVSRYENNLNFCEKLLSALGATSLHPVGAQVRICDNVNPQGGGEYLTDDEVMVGLKAYTERGSVMTLINAGVDIDTLRQVRDMEEEGTALVLVNCGLERLSWVHRLRFGKYFTQFGVSYCLKRIGGNGWLLKCGEEPWGIWMDVSGGVELLAEKEERPSVMQVQSEVRVALASIRKGGV